MENSVNSTASTTGARSASRLLIDWRPVQLQLVEGKQGKVVVRGEFGRADQATENKRVYPSRLWEREIRRLDKPMKERQVYGELDHPGDGRTALKRVSHLLTGLEVKDGVVVGEAEVLDTSMGKELKALLNSGCKVGVSSRGYGSTRTNEKGEDVVQEDYRLVTYDFVAEPASTQAYPDVFYESKGNAMDDEKMAQEFAKKLEAAKSEGRESAQAELRDEFAREILGHLGKLRAEVTEQVRGEMLSDPTVAGARTAIEQIKDVLRPYVLPEDAQTVAKQKDSEIGRLKNKISEQDLRIKELEADQSKLSEVAKEAGYKYYMERQIGSDPDAELLRNLVGDVTKYATSADLKTKLESVRGELAKRRAIEEKAKEKAEKLAEEARLSKERERDRAVAQESSLRDEVGQLQLALNKALEANKELGLQVYAESRLANHPKAAKLRTLIESSHPRTKEEVDALVENFREPARESDDLEKVRARVRAQVGGGFSPTNLDEEAPANGGRVPSNYQGLGASVSELRQLAGISRR